MFALTISWGKSPGDSLTIEHYPLCGVTYALTTIRRWAEFVRIVTAEILPRYHGVMVKSLGDGLLARFGVVPDAVDAAAEMHRTLAAQNAGIPALAWSDGIDIYPRADEIADLLAIVSSGPASVASRAARLTPVPVVCLNSRGNWLRSIHASSLR